MKGKKVVAAALSAVLLGASVGALSACGGGRGNKMVYWCFDADMEQQVLDYYVNAKELGYEIDIEVMTLDNLLQKLDSGLRTGKNLPDVVALEGTTFKRYIDGKILEELDDMKPLTSDMYDYTVEAASKNGHLYALATNVTPGVFAYRRSIAKATFGTDDPAEIQQHFNSWENFLASARALKEKNYKVLSSYMDIAKVFFGGRSSGWVDGQNNLVIDESLTGEANSLMETAKLLKTENLSNETAENTAAWYTDISGTDVFGYFQATWGIRSNLERNCTSATSGSTSFGDWAICEGPSNFFEGGTFHAVIKGTKWKDEAKDFVKFFSTDATYLTNWAKQNGDFMNSKSCMQAIADDAEYQNEFLGGQNPYNIYMSAASNINGEIITQYDSTINGQFKAWATNYAEGIKPLKSDCIAEFKNSIKGIYTSITVK